tara:strand:+ start:550 stop:900 length:351 start_codon:yes stop_codon:yes gene_type:complete
MTKKYFIIEELWREIKSFLFHNIKIHGKHLKNDKYVKNFNKVIIKLPRKYIPICGPKIVYQSTGKIFRCAKLVYRVKAPCCFSRRRNSSKYKLIVEYISLKNVSKQQIIDNYCKLF